MQNLSRSLGHLYKYICVAIIALMVIIVFINTMLRYVFNSGIVETEEVLRYLFIWGTFLGITAMYKDKAHIAVTIVTDRLSPRVATIVALLANFLVLYALYVLIDGSIMYIQESTTTIGQLTGLPFVYIIFASLFAACSITILVLIEMWQQIQALRQMQHLK